MLIIAYPHASVVLVISRCCMLRNEESPRHLLYSVTSVAVLFANIIKLNISTKKEVKKFY